MININTKIHDKFSIEFKVGFSGSEQDRVNDFSVNTWIFIPNSLDINSATYKKEHFYWDVKSNVRLITPDFPLSDLAEAKNIPLENVTTALQKWSSCGTQSAAHEYEFQIRMFAAIFKSALRDDTHELMRPACTEEQQNSYKKYVDHIRNSLHLYRQHAQPGASSLHQVYAYADEYMSHLADLQATHVIRWLTESGNPANADDISLLTHFIMEERQYKAQQGYSHLETRDYTDHQKLIHRHGLLKKNIESVLYLKVDTAPDSNAMQEVSFSVAAAVAMIISTLIALPFQRFLGNYPILIFIILVIAYMFKDRIKDFVRAKFAHRLKAKYYDSKTIIRFKDNKIGWIKEGADFINDAKTPGEVLSIRNRSALESDNAVLCEQTILYRKNVHIDNDKLRNQYQYNFKGINDILRLHIQQYTMKMDDPNVTLDSVNENGELHTINTLRSYVFHIVLQFVHDEQKEYRGFRITATRDGIEYIEEI